MAEFDDHGMDPQTHLDGLRAELANAKAAGYSWVKDIEAELKRLAKPAKETATKQAPQTPEG